MSCWIPSHIGIKEADFYLRACADDFRHRPYAQSHILILFKSGAVQRSQFVWINSVGNKLHLTKSSVAKWTPTMLLEKLETQLTRLRISHTRFTHDLSPSEGFTPCV